MNISNHSLNMAVGYSCGCNHTYEMINESVKR